MKEIAIFEQAGGFAENKDVAREIRLKEIIPELNSGGIVTLDFSRVDAVTQSFIHALISDLFRNYGASILDQVIFKACNEKIKKMINIVVDYMQEGIGDDGPSSSAS